MLRRVLLVIGLGTVLNLVLIATFGYNHSGGDDCAGLLWWSKTQQQWVTVEPAPEGSDLPLS